MNDNYEMEFMKEVGPDVFNFNKNEWVPFENMIDALEEVLDAASLEELMKSIDADKLRGWKETLKMMRKEIVACIPNYSPEQFRFNENGEFNR